VRFGVSDTYRHSFFLGPRWRERLIGAGDGFWRFATVEEKDRRIHLGSVPLALGGDDEVLGDGWYIPVPQESLGAARTVGREAELVFVSDRASSATLQLEIANIELEDGNRCSQITVAVDGVDRAVLEVGEHFAWNVVPLGALSAGRHHLSLRPHTIGVARTSNEWREGEWMTVLTNALTAIQLRAIALDPTGLGLPPEGPEMDDVASDRLFATGWLPVERNPMGTSAVWAIGRESVIRFQAAPGDARVLVIRGGPPPPSANATGQTVTFMLNGVALGEHDYSDGLVEEHELIVPAGTLHAGPNLLVLRFARFADEPPHRAYYLAGARWRSGG